MEETARVLAIVADHADYLLIESQLKQHNVPACCTAITDHNDLQDALAAGSWDVILVDVSIQIPSVSEVLDTIRSCMPDVPVILLVDSADGARAVSLFNQGVGDLVRKDCIDGLIPAIDRSLRNFFLRNRAATEKIQGEREKRLSVALAAARMGIWEWDMRAGVMYFSPECTGIIGLNIMRPALESFMEVLHPEDKARVTAEARRALDNNSVYRSEFRILRHDGKERWLLTMGKGEYDVQGNPLFLVSSVQDITDRKRTEERLQSSVQIWNTTFDAMNDAISVMDETGAIQRSNRAMTELTNKYPLTNSDHPCWKDVNSTDGPFPDCPFFRMLRSHQRESMTIQRLDRWFNIIADPIISRSNSLVGGVQIISDVTEHKQFEQKLKESEGKFRSLAEQSLVGTYIIQDNTLKYVNLRFAEMFGYRPEDMIEGMSLQDLVMQEERQMVEADIRLCVSQETQAVHNEFRGLKRTGETITAEVFASRALYLGRPAIIGIILDITEKKKLEQQLRQAQKMEAVGQLTSGIAHDFNNILSAITGYASLLQLKMNADDPNRAFAGQILTSADRAATLIRSLLTFSRKQITDLRHIDINEIIKRAEKLIHWILGENIDLRVMPASGQLLVNADPGQIEQVLMNLATNAADAMPRGGLLSIETAVVNIDALEKAPEKAQEKYVLISVTDTGVGMDEKTREKIFEPFFTTKDLGRGTGLGLSMVYGIIRQHNGSIQCSSEPGVGTSFNIYLPLLSACDGPGEAGEEVLPTDSEHPRGTETVLVAEDDETLMSLAKTTLEAFGYTVIGAADGKEAIERFLLHKDQVQLVLSDVIMPGRTGAEIEKAIRAEAPDIPILFMSGYAGDIVYRKSLIDRDAQIISKPFSPSLLLKRIGEMLNGRRTGRQNNKEATGLH